MLKTIVIYIIVVALFGVLFISTSRTAMKQISGTRSVTEGWWGEYKGVNGDLSNMAYLDFVENYRKDTEDFQCVTKNYHNDINLYLRGDSYIRSIPGTAYSFLSSIYFSDRWQTNYVYNLERDKKNILIIEISERFMRENYNDLRLLKYFTNDANAKGDAPGNELLETDAPELGIASVFFNKNINQNLEYNLFNYRFLNPVFESKAALNFYLLGRASGEVVVSRDKDFLLLRETMLPTGTRSSFSPLPLEEVTLLVNNLNTIYTHYLAEGFDDVYFCIVPNPVTLLQPDDNYNNLVPLVQYDPRLRMKIIDLYKVFKERPELYYEHGDTHWNNRGKAVWINTVNEILVMAHRLPPKVNL